MGNSGTAANLGALQPKEPTMNEFLEQIAYDEGVDNLIALVSGFLREKGFKTDDLKSYINRVDTAMEANLIRQWSEKQKLQYQAYLDSPYE